MSQVILSLSRAENDIKRTTAATQWLLQYLFNIASSSSSDLSAFPISIINYQAKKIPRLTSVKMRFSAIISVAITLVGFAAARPSERTTGMPSPPTLLCLT